MTVIAWDGVTLAADWSHGVDVLRFDENAEVVDTELSRCAATT